MSKSLSASASVQLRNHKLISFLQARLSPEGYLGLHLTVGLLVIVLSTWIFGSIAEDVYNRENLTFIDVRFSDWVYAKGPRWFTRVMLLITHAHATLPIFIMIIGISAFMIWRRRQRWVLALILTVGGGMLLNVLLKNVFQRARPTFAEPILTLTSYGFPSGHTMAATCLWGLLAAFGFAQTKSLGGRLLVVTTACLMILLVGFSRIYLGAHYLSDVLGAMVEGLAWLAFTLTAVETLRRARRQRKTKAG